MTQQYAAPHAAPIDASLTACPAMVMGLNSGYYAHNYDAIMGDKSPQKLTLQAAYHQVKSQAPFMLMCHSHALAVRLNFQWDEARPLDILELFAFVRPAQFCLPTVQGVAQSLGLANFTDEADPKAKLTLLYGCAHKLIREYADYVQGLNGQARQRQVNLLMIMNAGKWGWAVKLLGAIGIDDDKRKTISWNRLDGLDCWRRLPEWQEQPPAPPPGNQPITPEMARAALYDLTIAGEQAITPHGGVQGGVRPREQRSGQQNFAEAVSIAFRPRLSEKQPNLALAEAGTGIGKTLGYIAPAHLWAKTNQGPVWLSTYTRNLQQQIASELERLYPDPIEKRQKIVVRKGRENYLCLLNYEEEVNRLGMFMDQAPLLGLLSRWLEATEYGDMNGSDFPAWLAELFHPARLARFPDKRGECIYSACSHYQRCFGENVQRQSKQAELVVANHALTILQAVRQFDDPSRSTRLVFDEGHHLFEAADSAFSLMISGAAGQDLRRYIRGSEDRRRVRGLDKRFHDSLPDSKAGEAARLALGQLQMAAAGLPGAGWRARIFLTKEQPEGAFEAFLAYLSSQVFLAATPADMRAGYSLESEVIADEELGHHAEKLLVLINKMLSPAKALARAVDEIIANPDAIEPAAKLKLEQNRKSLDQRVIDILQGWAAMAASIIEKYGASGGIAASKSALAANDNSHNINDQLFDWFEVSRHQGEARDCAMVRAWIDPSLPLAKSVLEPAHGVVIASATLTAGAGEQAGEISPQAWLQAESLTGASHLPEPVVRFRAASPFDYPKQSKVILINDVDNNQAKDVAGAISALLKAADGGGVGLFTSINRLKTIHNMIAPDMEQLGLPLYAQHVDGLGTASLIDLFRADERASILGTDALRDGMDVPGRSLKLLIYDRLPWPRPDLLHKARRDFFSAKWGIRKSDYDDMITRKRLRQAFGRLVRVNNDHGVFVMLDRRFPSRLLDAFPAGVSCQRMPIHHALAEITSFLG